MRPLNKQEQELGSSWRVDSNTIYQCDPQTGEPERGRDVKYSLDNVFAPGTSTHELYAATTQNLMTKLVSGFNSTVFAYGQVRERQAAHAGAQQW